MNLNKRGQGSPEPPQAPQPEVEETENLPAVNPAQLPAKVKGLVTYEMLLAKTDFAAEMNEINILVNKEPKKEWIKPHKYITIEIDGVKQPYLYMPTRVYHFLLTMIYQRWRWEIKETKNLFNSVVVTGRLHYWNPAVNDWDFQDGVGAVGVQTDAGAAASDMGKMKQDAIMKAAPAADTYAFKNACKKLGRLFGRDLSKDGVLDYSFLNKQSVNA